MKTFAIAKMLVCNDKGEILALRRSQNDERRPGQWDFPGGWVDEDEDARVAAMRETQEETGISVTKCRLGFAFSEPADEHGSGTWLLFLTNVTGRPAVKLSDEHDKAAWMTLDQALQEFIYDRQKKMLEYVRDNALSA